MYEIYGVHSAGSTLSQAFTTRFPLPSTRTNRFRSQSFTFIPLDLIQSGFQTHIEFF